LLNNENNSRNNGSFRFPYASKVIYEIYEVTPEEVKDNHAKAFSRIHPDDQAQVINFIKESAKNLTIWHNVYRVILPKQVLKWLEGNAAPEKLNDGSVLWHGNIRDITEKKKKIFENLLK
jgi:PAS domain-containing protein